jgi:hypothetical protein
MFSAAKAQFDLAMAWSELAMSTFTATTMIANSSAKVMAASATAEKAGGTMPGFFNPWIVPATPSGMADPVRFAFAATQATTAFWAALMEPPKPAHKPVPLWWTAFTDPLTAAPATKPEVPASQTYLLH